MHRLLLPRGSQRQLLPPRGGRRKLSHERWPATLVVFATRDDTGLPEDIKAGAAAAPGHEHIIHRDI